MAAGLDTVDAQDEQTLTEAVAIANIPTLLMVLVQLTGERHWLEAPYRPARARGMGDNDTRRPARRRSSRRSARPPSRPSWPGGPGGPWPSPSPRPSCSSRCCPAPWARRCPREYGPMIVRAARPPRSPTRTSGPARRARGLPGADRRRRRVRHLCAAVNLQTPGHPLHDRREERDGRRHVVDNHYPGAGVDTPNHLYSFSFATYDWSMYFALRDELHAYLEDVADRVRPAPEHPLRHRGRARRLRRRRARAGP